METGKIVYYFEHREIISGICLSEKDNKYHLLLPKSKEINLQKKRLIHLSSYTVDISLPKDVQLSIAAEKNVLQNKISRAICISDLWKSLKNKGQLYDISFLTKEIFKNKSNSDREMAVIRSIMNDSIYFKMQNLQFLANTLEQVEKLKIYAEKERKTQKEISDFSKWLNLALEKNTVAEKNSGVFLTYLKQYTISGKNVPCYTTIKNTLKSAQITTQKDCFDFLVKAGVFDEDENLLFQKHQIHCAWPETVINDTVSLIGPDNSLFHLDKSRGDLTGINTFSIDDASTMDIDDALSFEEHHDFFIIYVHITDVASVIKPGTAIDLEAKRRGRSIYLPEGKSLMLPDCLSENYLSLKQGEIRPAVSFKIKLSLDGDILDFSAQTSLIKNDRKMSYDETDNAIKTNPLFEKLYNLTLKLRKKRLLNGARSILLPELQLEVNQKKEIKIKKRERKAESQILVSECMILANYCASLIFRKNNFPALYRKQTGPANKIEQKDNLSLFELFSMKRNFEKVTIDTNAEPHNGLGLDSYTTITSPVRKYLDLVTQRQLLNLLRGEKPEHDPASLEKIADSSQLILTKAAIVEQEREKYWLLKVLQKSIGEKKEALILGKKFKRYSILLTEFYMDLTVRASERTELTPGETIYIIIEKADPFNGTLQASASEI
jgi:exoribonuclease-2